MKLSANKNKDVPRISWVDHARGIAILLVVYRHVVVGMQRSGIPISDFMYNTQEVFYNFRMPVFFILSGVFIMQALKKKSALAVLKYRAATILYPYLIWAVILVSLEFILSDYTNAKRGWHDYLHIITQPRAIDHLWYLFALFNATAVFLLFNSIIKQVWLNVLISLLLHGLTFTSFLQGQSLISDAFYFYPYFYLGTILSQKLLDQSENTSFLNAAHLKWLLPLFLAGQFFWFIHREEEADWFMLFLAINLVACYVVYITAREMCKTAVFDFFSYIGKYSLYIYIMHVPLAAGVRNIYLKGHINASSWLILASCWIVGLLVPIISVNLLRNTGFLRLFSLKSKPSI